MSESEEGPIPIHVTVPGGTSVKPASVIKLEIKPISLACRCNLRSSDSSLALRTTFFWPSLNQLLKFDESDFFDLIAQLTD